MTIDRLQCIVIKVIDSPVIVGKTEIEVQLVQELQVIDL